MGLSKLSYIAACLETTPGTQATAPQLYIPCKSNLKNKRKPVYPPEERGNRDGNYVRRDTVLHSEWDVKGAFYPDSFGLFLIGFMGSDTPTQPDATHAPTVYKHTLGFASTPPSLSFWKNYDPQLYQSAYNIVEKVQFKIAADGKLVDMDISGKGNSFKTSSYVPTVSFSTVNPFQGYLPTIKVAKSGSSTVQTSDIEELTIDLEQKATLWFPISGSPEYAKVYFGERTAKIDFTARFDTTATIWDHFNAGEDMHFTFDMLGDLIVNSGPSGTPPNTDYFHELNLDFPIVGLDEADHDLGKDMVTFKAKGVARPGAVANSTFSAFLQNTISAYTPA